MWGLLISGLFLQTVWSYDTSGVGAFSYQNSFGKRYDGTYEIQNGQIVNVNGEFPPDFQVNAFNGFDNFYPEYFRNLGNFLQEAFVQNIESQNLALNAARKAFDITSSQASYIPNYFRFPDYNAFPDFMGDSTMPQFGRSGYSAYSSASIGPGYSHQKAAISPENKNVPNVDEWNTYENRENYPQGGSVSVSSSASSSSSNVNGKIQNHREAETVINDNGKITRHKVYS